MIRDMLQIIVGSVVVMPLCFAPASASDCSDAADAYNTSTSDISDYLRRYVNCVSGSQGRDDCSSECRRLKNAQDDFESAVSSYQINDCGE